MAGGRTQHLFVLMFLCLKMRTLCRFLGGHVGTAPTVGMTVVASNAYFALPL